jgi:hypothetical protein
MHGRLHTTTAAIAYLRGAHAAPAAIQTTNLTTTPELFGVKYAPNVCCVQKLFLLRVGGAGRPRIRLPSASQKFSWCLASNATCLASSADPKPFANKPKPLRRSLALMSRSQEHWAQDTARAVWPKQIPTLSPRKTHSKW